MDSTRLRSLALFAALTLVAGMGFAQVTASVTGRVDDPSGAGIPGTTVTVTSGETGATRTVTRTKPATTRFCCCRSAGTM